MQNNRHTPFLLCTFIFLCSLFSSALQAQTFFTTNGTAVSTSVDCYQMTAATITQAGSIYDPTPVDFSQPFGISGTMNFGNDDGGADGITFILTTSTTALGNGGGGIAYEGILASVVIEFDTWQNPEVGDPFADHMGIVSAGSPSHTGFTALSPAVPLPNLEDGQDKCFEITWTPGSQTLSATLDGNTVSYSGNIPALFFASAPDVYMGFTSSTGGAFNQHVICFSSPTVEPMEDITICEGESTVLQADPNAETYSWTPDPTLSSFNTANPIATPTTTTLYTVLMDYGCGLPQPDDVLVTVNPAPQVIAGANSPLCAGETLQLTADNGGTSYAWTGPGNFTSNEQNPQITDITAANQGIYTVTTTGANGCVSTAEVNVIILPAVAVIVPQPPHCGSTVQVQYEGIPAGGTWGGVADINGLIYPAQLSPGFHQITYTATDGSGCTAFEEITIEILPSPTIDITSPLSFCENDAPQTLTATPAGGTWGGTASTTGQISPQAMTPGLYPVSYTVGDPDCQVDTIFDIEITAAVAVEITVGGPYCPDAGVQQFTASVPGGIWGGIAEPDGTVNPSVIPAGTYEVTYTTSGGCAGTDSDFIEILPQPTAEFQENGSYCENLGEAFDLQINVTGTFPITVEYTIDNVPQTAWMFNEFSNFVPVSVAGIYEIINVTDASGCTGPVGNAAEVTAADAPVLVSVTPECTDEQDFYSVQIEITGGDPDSYTANGSVPGNFSAAPPYVFTSQLIPSGDDYEFFIFDDNVCGTLTVDGSFSCACVTDVGTMQQDTLRDCVGTSVTAIHDNNEILDDDDALIYILHDGSGNAEGTIFDSADTPTFFLVPPMQTGVTYYISAVAGNMTADGVDFDDSCLSVSVGTPVVWREFPTAVISGDTEICPGETAEITFNFTGTGDSFSGLYGLNTGSDVDFVDFSDGEIVEFTPTQNTTIDLLFVYYGDNPQCDQIVSSTVEITIVEAEEVATQATVCAGESILLGGAMQSEPGIYIDTLNTAAGCDSIVFTALSVIENDTTFLNDVSCNPAETGVFTTVLQNENLCDSTVILTVTFSETDTTQISSTTCDPDAAGIFTQDLQTAEGCDSTVIETIILLESDTTFLNDISCNPAETGTFITVLQNENLCDSTIILTVTFSETDTTQISSTTCDPDAAGIFTQDLQTAEGCDSTVIETIILLESDTTFLNDISCNPAETGVFTTVLQNENLCDSTVILTVTFSETDTTEISSTTCAPDAAGVFTQDLQTAEGCDSTVIETIILLESDTTFLNDVSCNPAETGTFTTVLQNENLCDSTIILTVAFSETDTTQISSTTCDPDAAGIFIQDLQTAEGCDSTVIETIILLESDTTFLNDVSCNPAETGTFTTVLQNENLCDSTIILTVAFSETDTTQISSTTCDPDAAGIFIQDLQTAEGCDSTVVETIILLESATTFLNDVSCNPAETGIFTTVLQNENLCDSTIILTVDFVPLDTTEILHESCEPDEVGTFFSTVQTSDGCDSTIVEIVTLLPSDTTILDDIFVCNPDAAGMFETVFENQFGCDSLVIFNAISAPSENVEINLTTCDPAEVGTQTFAFVNQFGCDSIITEITVLLPPDACGTEAQIVGSIIGCNDATGFFSVTVSVGQSPFAVEYAGAVSGTGEILQTGEPAVFDNIPPGIYTVSVTDANGFSVTETIAVEQTSAPEIETFVITDFNGFSIGCADETDGAASATASGGTQPYTWFWSNGADTPTAENLAAGSYTVTVTDAENCEDTGSVELTAPAVLDLTFAVTDADCFTANSGTIFVQLTGGIPPYSYQINNGAAQTENFFTGLAADLFTVTASDAGGCTVTESIAINAPLPPSVVLTGDTLIDLGDSLNLTALTDLSEGTLDSIIWTGIDSTDCPGCTTQLVMPLSTTTYSVEIIGDNGCSDSDNLTVVVDRRKQIFVPNAFSPDGSGFNEIVYIFADAGIVENIGDFHITDRWGESVFRAFNFLPNDPNYGWDGVLNGQLMNNAVFVWYAEVTFIDGETKVFTGDITLLR